MSQVSDLLNNLVNKSVWGARRSHGSSFFFEIGNPHLRIREPSPNPEVRIRSPILGRRRITPVGEYSILIISCFWAIDAEEFKITDDFDTKTIDEAIEYLNGTYITAIDEHVLPHARVIFYFDTGSTLTIEPNPEVGMDDNWSIHVPEDATWALCPDGTIRK